MTVKKRVFMKSDVVTIHNLLKYSAYSSKAVLSKSEDGTTSIINREAYIQNLKALRTMLNAVKL